MSPGQLFPTLLLLLLAVNLSLQQGGFKSVIPNYKETLDLPKNSIPQYYQIDLTELPDETDISISLASTFDTAPKIYVSTRNQSPKDTSSSEYNSVNFQGGILFIPFNELKGIEKIYLGMFCTFPKCKADFEVEYSKELHVLADGYHHSFKDELLDAASAVVRINVPETPDIDRIIISLSALSTSPTTIPYLKVYLNKGERIPDSNQAEMIPMSAWFEARTTVIYKEDDLFCTNCVYTLSAKFSEGASLSIQVTAVGSVTDLNNRYFTDVIQKGQTNEYSYELIDLEEDDDIIIDVSPQKGSLSLDIRCDTDTGSTQGWQFRVDKKLEDIVITPKEREECTGESFQISVESEEPTIYNIRIFPAEENDIYLGKGIPVSGDLDPEEFVEYELAVPYYATEKIEFKLTGSKDITITLINCRFPNECPGMSADFTKTIELNDIIQDFKYETESLGGNERQIVVDPHNGGCYPLLIAIDALDSVPVPACAYKLKLLNKGTEKAEYSLSADLQGHAMLFPSIPLYQTISADELQYYMINAPENDLSKVTFQLTVFTGRADIFVSKTEKYPTKRSSEGQLEHEGFVAFQKKDGQNLQGTYYVSIKAYETTSYSLTPVLVGSTGKAEGFAIFIDEGVPHKGVLFPKLEFPVQYFKFDIDVATNWEGSIKIAVTPLRGNLVLTAGYNTVTPDPVTADFHSETGTLEIYSKDPHFKRRGTIYIGVYVDWTDPRSYSMEDIPYYVVYTIQHGSGMSSTGGVAKPSNIKPIVLTTQFPHHGVIQAREIMYFKVYILAEDESITLFKQADVGDINLYVSTHLDNEFPDQSNYDYSTSALHLNELTLEKADLEQACKGKKEANKLCEINFAVISAVPEGKVTFTLSLTRNKHTNNPLMLEDGRQSRFNLPQAEKPATFFFYPTPKQDTFIVVSAHNKIVTIYANRRQINLNDPNANEKEVPTPDKYDFISTQGAQHAGFAHLLIARDTEDTSPVITLTIYFDDTFNNQPDTEDKNANSFRITASSHITEMHTGSPVIGHVAKASYQYYFVNVHRVDCTLVLSLTSLDDGDPDLLVSQGWVSRPTLEDHQFASISRLGTEVLKIKTADVYPKTSMEGLWIIGVYGRTESTYTLTVVYEDMNTLELTQGIPVEMYLEAGSEIYYKYLHQSDKDLDLKIEELSGEVIAYVGTLSNLQQPTRDTLPSATKNIGILDPWETSSLKIQGSTCPKCLYYIKLEVRQSSKFIIMMIEEQNIASLTSTVPYEGKLDVGASKKFMFFAKNSDEVDLSVSIKTGSLGIYVSNNPLVNKTTAIWNSQISTSLSSTVIKMSKNTLNEKKAQQGVWDGKQEVLSVGDTFFFNFVNEGKTTAEFNYAILLRDASLTLRLGDVQVADFDPDEKKSFLYYSPHISGITSLEIAYCMKTPNPTTKREKNMYLSEALEGFDFQATFWPQKVTAGKGEEAMPEKNDIIITNVDPTENDHQQICLKQTVVLENQAEEGKYEFVLKNLYNMHLNVALKVDTTETDYKVINTAIRTTDYIYPNFTKDFEILLPDKGAWYFTLFSCQGKFSYIIGDTPEAVDNTAAKELSGTGFKRAVSARMYVDEPTKKFIRIQGIDTESVYEDEMIEYLMVSSFSQDDKLIDYSSNDPKWGDLYVPNMVHEYNFNYDESEFIFKFNPIKIEGFSADDTLSYYVRLCPEGSLVQKDNYCTLFHPNSDCITEFQAGPVSETFERKQKYQNVPPGKYVVHVVGNVNHGGNNVMPFAYKTYEVELKEPILYQLWDFIYYLTAGILLLICLAFSCRKISQVMKDDDTRREYGVVGGDE